MGPEGIPYPPKRINFSLYETIPHPNSVRLATCASVGLSRLAEVQPLRCRRLCAPSRAASLKVRPRATARASPVAAGRVRPRGYIASCEGIVLLHEQQSNSSVCSIDITGITHTHYRTYTTKIHCSKMHHTILVCKNNCDFLMFQYLFTFDPEELLALCCPYFLAEWFLSSTASYILLKSGKMFQGVIIAIAFKL